MSLRTIAPRSLLALLLLAALLACNLSRYASEGEATPSETDPPVAAGTLAPTPAGPTTPTAGAALPGTPAVSAAPEAGGVRVAYVKDGALWLWAAGAARPLTHQGPVFQPKLSPDGVWVAFLRPAGDFHIEPWVVAADGVAAGAEHRAATIADLDAIGGGVRDPNAVAIIPAQFEWMPDGLRLAFNTQQVYNGPGSAWLDDLHWASAAGEGVQSLFLPTWGGAFALSPDGEHVALAKTDAILLSRLDGGDYRQVMSYPPVITYSEYRYYAEPHWAPDGSFLRLALPPADPLAAPPQPTTLWKIPLDGGSPQQEGSLQPAPFFDAPVVYSPDLSRLAYITQPDPSGPRSLHLADFAGQGDLIYASDPLLHFVGWSPDGKQVAYLAGDEQALWIGPVDGAPQPYPALSSGVTALRWVDTGRFVAVRQQGEGFTLLLGDLAGRTMEIDTFRGVPPEFDVR